MVLAVFLLVGISYALPGLTPEAHAACDISPEGKVEVVSNNVYEAEKSDAGKPGDMKRFVDRMAEMVSNAPDVVLVQEVRRSAVANIRTYLANKFGCNYTISVNASKTGWRWVNNHRIIGQDAAVILNSDSMALDAKGFVANDYDLSQSAPGEPVKVKKAAWVKVVEKDLIPGVGPDLLRVAAASAHYPRANHFKTEDIGERLAARFSEKIAKKLEATLPDDSRSDNRVHVFGGDLNMHRFEGSPANPTPMYRAMTTAPFNLKDPIIELTLNGNPNPIDFIFTSGSGARAEKDNTNTHNESSPAFYSNHDLRWAMIEGPDKTPPTQPGNVPSTQGYGSFTRMWGWSHSRDGGTGFDGYVVYRKRPSEANWDAIKRNLMDNDFTDQTVNDGTVYEYKITALDKSGNESASNSVLEIQAGK